MIDSTPWAGRRHGGQPTVPLDLSHEDRAALEDLIRPGKVEKRVLQRAQALLLMADGVPLADIGRILGVHRITVIDWRKRFSTPNPLLHLKDAPRTGRPRSLFRKPSARTS